MSHAAWDEWSRTETVCTGKSTIAEQFAEQAALTPDKIALIANGRKLSYHELDLLTNRLARRLQGLGVHAETLVGVAMERSEVLIISLLAILKAGGAYLPLDPTYPQERLSLMIADSGMQLLLSSVKLSDLFPPVSGAPAVLFVEQFLRSKGDILLEEHQPAVSSGSSSHNLAYMIYTSGSTGRPKGVMIENRNVINFFTGMDRAIGCEPGIWLAVTGISFDISVLELLWTLTRGFTVVLHGGDGSDALADEIDRYGVTHLQMTPSLAQMLTLNPRAFAALGSLKQILLGGEAVPVALIRRIRQGFSGKIFNMYGPTETTIWSTTHPVAEVTTFVSIGRPIANTQVFLLDEESRPVATGDIGELYLGGDGVARGYWKRPELTAERFLMIPELSPQPIYRTGDLARYLPDGNIEFLGRCDFQIKLRGHRIELGEIENALEQIPGIRQAVVVVREDRAEDKRLAAYLVADQDAAEDPEALRSILASLLPDYMVPSAFVFLSAMPLTANGKTDRKALLALPPPVYGVRSMNGSSTQESVAGGASEIERKIAQACQQALGVHDVGLHENFFDLGAHSLTIAEIQTRLQAELGREIAIVDLYQFSTVRSLAGHLAGAAPKNQLSDRAQRRRLARQG